MPPESRHAVAKILGPSGPLSEAIPGYEDRPEQVRMAEAVAEALEAHRHLIVEAGTGVGKSFAYLVPALLWASERAATRTDDEEVTRVAVATSTIALQEQLVGKDLPTLADALDLDVSFTLVKGRGNFVCLRRLSMAVGEANDLFAATEERAQLLAIREWAEAGGGSRQELPFEPFFDVWEAARAESGNCLHQDCPHYKRCAYQEARARMRSARLLVMNHHVLLSDLALRRSGVSFLPKVDAVIVDEAHDLEDAAAECLGTRLSSRGVQQVLGRLWNDRRGTGLLAKHADPAPKSLVDDARRLARAFFDRVRLSIPGGDGAARMAAIEGPLSGDDGFAAALDAAAEAIGAGLASVDSTDLARELEVRARSLEALSEEVTALVKGPDADHAMWAEWDSRGNVSLTLSPIDVGPDLQKALYGAHESVILTSATLATGKPPSFRFARERLGLADAEELSVGSPFDFARQARIVVRTDVPDPSQAPEAYEAALPEAVLDAVRRTGGGAFVLFTSYEAMKKVAAAIRAHLTGDGLLVLVQGENLPRTAMLDAFRARNSVLFGVSSFWQGVDVPGDALRNVVIARLPFDVPTHPLQKARQARLEREGKSAFAHLSLPGAAIRLKQGFGRLIRRATDKGLVVILDPRVVTKRYGRTLLSSLPECPVVLEPEAPHRGDG